MKFLIVLYVAISAASAAVLKDERSAQIIRHEQDASPDGSFVHIIETENGILQGAQGTLKNLGADGEAEVIQGEFSYPSPEGEIVKAAYVADEGGFKITGSHIPVPPPIPPLILRALQWIATHPPIDRSAASGYYLQ